MEFTSHMIRDGHPHNGAVIGWAVAGAGKIFAAPTRAEAEGDALAAHPDATFRESKHSVDASELPLLLRGESGYAHWIRSGRPAFDIRNGLPSWDALEVS